MFNFLKFKNEIKFADNYFISLTEFLKFITEDHSKMSELIENNREAFAHEFLLLLFWLSISRFHAIFDNEKRVNRILDRLHNIYYSYLQKRRNVKKDELQNICDAINDRYRNYNGIQLDNNYFYLSRTFLEHIDLHNNNTDYKNDLAAVADVSWYIKFFQEKTSEILNAKFIKENYDI